MFNSNVSIQIRKKNNNHKIPAKIKRNVNYKKNKGSKFYDYKLINKMKNKLF